MYRILLLLLAVCTLFYSCNNQSGYEPKGLRKLTSAELIDRARRSHFHTDSVTYRNKSGKPVTREDFLHMDPLHYTTDSYVDTDGKVKELVIRPATQKDLELRNKMKEAFNEGPKINLIPVDCSQMKPILQQVYEKDQKNRTNLAVHNPETDFENQQQVISLIETCGFPLSEQAGVSGIFTIFLVIQHASLKVQEKYFPLIKQSADRGDLGQNSVAMMEDRILIGKGLKQKYGSQVTRKGHGPWQLLPVEDPVNLNKRRAQVGLGPIEEYLSSFNIQYKPEK